jgi:hypothetical protein
LLLMHPDDVYLSGVTARNRHMLVFSVDHLATNVSK